MKLDDTICYCFHVTKRKIVNFIRVRQPRRASQVSGCGGAGTGCGWCVPFLKKYFDECAARGEVAEDAVSAVDYSRGRTEYIRSGKGTPPPGATPADEGVLPP